MFLYSFFVWAWQLEPDKTKKRSNKKVVGDPEPWATHKRVRHDRKQKSLLPMRSTYIITKNSGNFNFLSTQDRQNKIPARIT